VLALALSAAIEVSVQARAVQPGELAVLTIALPEHRDRLSVRAFDRAAQPFAIDDRTWRALIGIDLDTAPGTYRVAIDAGDGMRTAYSLVVRPKRFRTRRLTVDEAFVTPPPALEERIAREAALLARTWEHSAPERLWTAPFVRPVLEPANSAFGTRSVFNGKPRNPHSGADFLSPSGTPIHAPGAGTVVLVRDLYFSGNTVVIDHGLGMLSLFAHLSSVAVHEGDRIARGDVLGLVGATGRVTGPHLHWAIRVGGARVDPLSLLAVLGPEDR
jgi:murein DD-endopeptidase MepM/ murein hydrolase activator NlpD